ncbi:ROK [Methylophilales bacterium HTCC2181]|uniref:ROK n=1 Tax=Methylophilales bacterium HTCC2181 TaxID=383631 RepID=A0P4R0_9PROT|nr:ROK [Methylophilales bacterium HTCC2181]
MTKKYHIGIDLGGTKTEIAILDTNLDLIYKKRLLTGSANGPEYIISQIGLLYEDAKAFISSASHSVGVGTPGSLSVDKGLLRNSNTLCLNGLPLKKLIEDKIQHEIYVENDANCFALAEAIMGSGKGHQLVFAVIMGTGCGGGFVINQSLRIGPQKIAGEWGHSVLHSNGPKCYCGKNGCIEMYVSGGGLEKILRDNNVLNTTAEQFLNRKRYGAKDRVILNNFYADFGLALGNVINIIDPDIVVLGGGLSNHQGLYDIGKKLAYNKIFHEHPTTPIVRNILGDSSGVIGAALLARN